MTKTIDMHKIHELHVSDVLLNKCNSMSRPYLLNIALT